MDYKEKYEQALERAKGLYNSIFVNNDILEQIFPELKESEGEKIKKEIISFLKEGKSYYCPNSVRRHEWVDWLEKQGEKIDKLIKYREWLISETERWTEKEKDKTNSNAGKHCCIGAANAFISARAEFEKIFDYESWLKKQGKQKPIDYNEELKKCRDNPLYFFDKYVKIKFKGQGEQIDIANKEYWRGYREGKQEILDKYAELEKQGDKNTANKVEPKFKVGDWVIYCNEDVDLITGVEESGYIINKGGGYIPFVCENDMRLWTIQDAKDGDILASNKSIFIFQEEYIGEKPTAYGGLMNGLFIEGNGTCWTNEKCYPAIREQRDLLFQKMHEAGYEWDAEKKELKKIEQKPAESRQETKPNGGIVYEDFNKGDGYYKVNLAYLSKSQVEHIENLVASWQNSTNNTSEWSEEDEEIIEGLNNCLNELEEKNGWRYTYVNNKDIELNKIRKWLKSLKRRIKEK